MRGYISESCTAALPPPVAKRRHTGRRRTPGLEEGKTEPQEEGRRESAAGGNGIQGGGRCPGYAVKDAAPGIVVAGKEVDPGIEGRYGDLPMVTVIRDRPGTEQVPAKDGKDEPEGIGTKRDQEVREEGMRMAA